MNNRVKLIRYIIIALFIGLGVFIRFNFRLKPTYILSANNLVAYYYDISNRLYTTGKLPEYDKLRLAPLTVKENAPPVLAITSVLFYKLNHLIFPRVSFLDFAFYLPIVIYAIWEVIGIFITHKIFKNPWSVAVFLISITLLPIAIYYTKYGMYTEEFLGAFLTFCFFGIYIIWLVERKKQYWFIDLLLLILLEMTWQQFHFVLFVIFVGSIATRQSRTVFLTIILILVSLLISQLFSWVIGSSYSSIGMLYELYYGLRHFKDKDLQIAMYRADWRHLTFKDIIDSLGFMGFVTIIISTIKLAITSKNNVAYLNLLVGLITSFLLMSVFIKSRVVFLPFLLLAIGGCMISTSFRFKKIK
ncbi:hypothetical protein M1328_02245 [Patescibacteria group bacterium]|nr:hypothetical protein [Patescibacteria group bacterium]